MNINRNLKSLISVLNWILALWAVFAGLEPSRVALAVEVMTFGAFYFAYFFLLLVALLA